MFYVLVSVWVGAGGDKSLRLDHLLIILSEVKTVIEQNILGQTNEF